MKIWATLTELDPMPLKLGGKVVPKTAPKPVTVGRGIQYVLRNVTETDCKALGLPWLQPATSAETVADIIADLAPKALGGDVWRALPENPGTAGVYEIRGDYDSLRFARWDGAHWLCVSRHFASAEAETMRSGDCLSRGKAKAWRPIQPTLASKPEWKVGDRFDWFWNGRSHGLGTIVVDDGATLDGSDHFYRFSGADAEFAAESPGMCMAKDMRPIPSTAKAGEQ